MKVASTRSEQDLFEASGRGDWEAVRELGGRIERRVRWLLGALGETAVEEACDLVRWKLEQRRPKGFSGPAPAFRAYLNKVIASQVVEVKQRYARLAWLDEPLPSSDDQTLTRGDLLERHLAPTGIEPLDDLASAQEGGALRVAFARLDERCRRLLHEREVDERPETEIAERLGMTANHVGVALHRCKRRLLGLLLETVCAATDPRWHAWLDRLAGKLQDAQAVAFRLWWGESRPVGEIARLIGHDEGQTRVLLARAKAQIWQLAQETGAP